MHFVDDLAMQSPILKAGREVGIIGIDSHRKQRVTVGTTNDPHFGYCLPCQPLNEDIEAGRGQQSGQRPVSRIEVAYDVSPMIIKLTRSA
ncbi:hypothetical protein C8J38_11145 [Rhizobium sp. PP-WC-2G-219]|nr:hypothetical protein C8J37_13311 [Rhizobium sp. PP-WC-1G-195]TCL89678.1 hypothetical protein C8J38_11145 [Rhizobium sp. PP-WC-2G-219]TCQ14811.1 hypothetical protein C8J33_12311 [Rhizobium sp. PP-CC-3G-465]